jgi:acetoin utilization deacetylase AcuC-like enzyme
MSDTTVGIFAPGACLAHAPDRMHPESPARLRAILSALETAGLPVLPSGEAPLDALEAAHPAAHIAMMQRACERAEALDPDTPVIPASWAATLAASGAALAALDHAERHGTAFALGRPPGHHAEAARAMGFCLVNHAAFVARTAQRRGAGRVLVVDWDVHHGNGTQAILEDDAAMRFVSMHQWPWYPGTGALEDRGSAGAVRNVPLPPGLARERYVEALWAAVQDVTTGHPPDLVVVSAGYDAMAGDPLGGFTLEPEDYATWIERLRTAFPRAPLVAVLEGGYAPDRLTAGVVESIRAMRG